MMMEYLSKLGSKKREGATDKWRWKKITLDLKTTYEDSDLFSCTRKKVK